MSLGIENLFILRLPKVIYCLRQFIALLYFRTCLHTIHHDVILQDHADRVREACRSDALRDRLKVEFNS